MPSSPSSAPWYTPVQPSLKLQGEDEVRYQEYAPAIDLRKCIYCYWELKTVRPLRADFAYRVVADGCIDWLVELQQPEDIYAAGLSTEYLEFSLGASFHYLGIRFLPAGLTQLFPFNASLLTNRLERLDAVLPKAAAYFTDLLQQEVPNPDRWVGFDQYFRQQLQQLKQPSDPRIMEALEHIHRLKGNLEIEELNTGLSPRQLRRLFHQQVGTSPKRFSKIVRFQQFLQAKPSVQSLRANKIYYDLGYYDQAHFVKEFRHHYGLPPNKALGDRG